MEAQDKGDIPLTPYAILRTAIKAVPPLKYALGVAGIGATVAIILGLVKDPIFAVWGILIVIGLMIILVLFSYAVQDLPGRRWMVASLAWSVTILFIAALASLFTSFVLGFPQRLASYFSQTGGPKTSIQLASPTPTYQPTEASPTASPNSSQMDSKTKPSSSPPRAKTTPNSKPILSLTPTPAVKSGSPNYTVTLVIPNDMNDARVLVDGEEPVIKRRLDNFIIIGVKPKSTNTLIRLVGKKRCAPIEQLIDKDQSIPVDCR